MRIWAPNSPEWVLVQFGTALAGLTLVTVNPALRAREVEYVLALSRARTASYWRRPTAAPTAGDPGGGQGRLPSSVR